MDIDSPDTLRERGASSEPCSTRPNPFPEDNPPPARKRQRVSNGTGSRSWSVDAESTPSSARHPSASSEPTSDMEPSQPYQLPLPQTPKQPGSKKEITEPTSSKVTINLRSLRPLGSPVLGVTSPPTPSKVIDPIDDLQPSIEIRDEETTVDQSAETISSSSRSTSPPIELVANTEDDSREQTPEPYSDDDLVTELGQRYPMANFPFRERGETFPDAARKIARFFEMENVDSPECFLKMAAWIKNFLRVTAGRESTWIENYSEYQDLWDTLPEIIIALSKRRSFFNRYLFKTSEARDALTDLFCQFARLTGRFVALDVKILHQQLLRKKTTDEPVLASRNYMWHFSFLFRKEDGHHIGRNLEQHYEWNWSETMTLMLSHFLDSGGSIRNMTTFTNYVSKLIPTLPRLVESLTDMTRLVHRTVGDAVQCLSDPDASHHSNLGAARKNLGLGYNYFRIMASTLDLVVDKHITALTPDVANVQTSHLMLIYHWSLSYDPSPAWEVLEAHQEKNPTIPRELSAQIISNEWKFEILRKLVMSSQMQLRVIGVTSMCTDLLYLFNKNKKDDPAKSPLLLYFARFILRHKLVEYIVGIGSHPEIISESSNVVGFLVATRTHTNQQTDMIWKIVRESEDSRLVEAILRMLGQIVNLHDLETLVYICGKIMELPIESFNVPLRTYADEIVKYIMTQKKDLQQPLNAQPYELFVRLVRESSKIRSDAPHGLVDIQAWALNKFNELISNYPEAPGRKDLYLSCLNDISKRSKTASGSIVILHSLLRPNAQKDLHMLANDQSLTKLLVDDLELNTEVEHSSLRSHSAAHNARREMMLLIILHEPATISSELGSRLWDQLVGSGVRSGQDREIGWQILNSALKKAGTRNTFLFSCYKDFLPRLRPEFYTLGTLDFTREVIELYIETGKCDLLEETQHPTEGAMEQLWRLILKARPNTIETPAVSAIVEIYTDSFLVRGMSRSLAHSIHLALVRRCLAQLSTAADKLKGFNEGTNDTDDESMVIIASDDLVQEQELIFTRSLVLLREFLRSHQSNPHFATSRAKSVPLNISSEIIGEPTEVKYQAFDGNTAGDIKTLSIGKQNNVATLFLSIKSVSGFKSCQIYHEGTEIHMDGPDLHQTLDHLHIGRSLLLVVRRDGDEITDENLKIKSATIEYEIIQHSDKLWEFLGMQEKLAREIYQFLCKFEVSSRLRAVLEDRASLYTDMFPAGQPFKCLYAVWAIREYIGSRTREGDADGVLITRAIDLIVAAIKAPEILDSVLGEESQILLATHMVECLIFLLKLTFSARSWPILKATSQLGAIPSENISKCLDSGLLNRLLHILSDAKAKIRTPLSIQLVAVSFEAMMESSFHSPGFWTSFTSHSQTPILLSDLLLGEGRVPLRKNIAKCISQRITWVSSLSTLSSTEFCLALWPFLETLIPKAVADPSRCEETLALALQVFRKIADTSIKSVDIPGCLIRWGTLLINYHPLEFVGRPELFDPVARYLANLLCWCAQFAKASGVTLTSNNLAIRLFETHLFPPLTTYHNAHDTLIERLPMLDSCTRKLICDTILCLTRDDEDQFKHVLEGLDSIVPYSEDDENPYAYDLGVNFDRNKSIKSPAGYVGLRNLSNTCYLNSLFTQLFMNVAFREFMMKVRITDNSTQKLLLETQKLFSYMQNSMKRYVDPTNLAASIRTYDETSIDVSIQMDVDEFYNLLFDRWESQIPQSAAKRNFRSFYGGQLVQQVKSKECPHISERLEPFSAIQCDIKGKATLEESLQAYVDGEVMEGDNKYKCSNCDRHVNAVKRACLKDIPDNLIFHLKRFDFNLRTMQRSKINDYFSFPQKIDMQPYTVEHLAEGSENTQDCFELVGILVHSGTAESGHYYSYIRERPSGPTPAWVEFNDDSVMHFDPASIEANCFGGGDNRGPQENGSYSFEKTWSAYMLFYQRSSVLEASQAQSGLQLGLPVRCDVSLELNDFIARENENLIRKYCLYDEHQAGFVLRMLQNMSNINKGRCSEEHALESSMISTTLSYMDQVVVRTKDIPDFQSFLVNLKQSFQACTHCSLEFLEWASKCSFAFRFMLIRHPDPLIRAEIASAVVFTLNKVKHEPNENIYGLYEGTSENGEEMDRDYETRIFYRVAGALDRMWDHVPTTTKSWPEYFGLLAQIAQLGRQESAVLVDFEFLFRILEMICADHSLSLSPQLSRMLNIISKRTKPVSYEDIIHLLDVLLKFVDFDAGLYNDEKRLDFLIQDNAIPLDPQENSQLIQHWTRTQSNILMEKLLLINMNEEHTLSVIATLIRARVGEQHRFRAAIMLGIKKSGSSPCRPYLRAALVFCEYVDDLILVRGLIEHITKITKLSDGIDGGEFLLFFKDLLILLKDDGQMDNFRFVVNQIPGWAPALLTSFNPTVRNETKDYIDDIITSTQALDLADEPDANEPEKTICNRMIKKLGISCLQYLEDEHVMPQVTALKTCMGEIIPIIDICKPFYKAGIDEDLNSKFQDLHAGTMPSIRRIIVEEANDDASEWEGSDEAFSSSEVMESIAELGGQDLIDREAGS